MDVVDAIAELPRYNFGSAFTDLPLQDYSEDFANNILFDNTHLVIVTAVTVTDSTVNSATGLNPTPTTRDTTPPATGGGGGGGGGSLALLSLLGLFGFGATRILRDHRQAYKIS
jgi:peptidyl-prolyl cis-trans isomerase A (cyclophilin A)